MAPADLFASPDAIRLEQGDVFEELPFPTIKYPLRLHRQSRDGGCTVHDAAQLTDKSKGSPSCGISHQQGILLSHGCEIDGTGHRNGLERESWLAAPVKPLAACGEKKQERVRTGTQPNAMYLPPSQFNQMQEWYVDFQGTSLIACRYFDEVKRLYALTEDGRADLWGRLGIFFSGLYLYQHPINCPGCGVEIDARKFLVESWTELE